MGRDGIYAMDSLSGIYALVVDNDKERRSLIGGILRYCGALVTPVDTPDAALTVMELIKPDVVVVDFTRPDDGGLAFIGSVRALKPEEGGVVAAVALGDGGANGELARSRGYDAYLTKPLDPWELCRVVSSLLTARPAFRSSLVFGLHTGPRVVRDPDVPQALVGVHVLVVDDDPDARELLSTALTYCGAFATSAATARDALDYLQAKPVDVVLVDVALPGREDGYWLVRGMSARPERRATPVIALTSGRGDGPDRTLAAGFQGHLRKPVDPWELCRVVASLARKP